MTGTADARDDDEYAALYREHNAGLVAYARSLTGSPAVAEDLAAEAHFRVWRRIRAGHTVENPAAYLTTTVRNLAAGLGRAQREISRDAAELPQDPARAETAAVDPEQRASHVDLISRLLKELPERWAKALWYAEVEDLPMEAVGEHIGASAGTTAVVLTRARERLRQAFLHSQPGRPANEECEQYWKQMPTLVRATASARQTKHVLEHCEGCEDCRTRMLELTEANTRLPLLLGPALLGIVLGGGTWLLPTAAGAGAVGAAGGAKAAGAAGTAARAGSGARHARISARAQLIKHGVSPTKAAVYGSVAAVGIAVTVATVAFGSTPPSRPTAATRPQATARSTVATQQTATAGDPTSAAAAPSTTAPTSASLASSAADDAATPAQQTSAASSTSPATTPAAAATTTAPAATMSAAGAPDVVDSSSAPAAAATTPPPTPTLTLTPTQTPSQPSSSPTQTPTGSSPTSGPTPPPCELEILGFCVIR